MPEAAPNLQLSCLLDRVAIIDRKLPIQVKLINDGQEDWKEIEIRFSSSAFGSRSFSERIPVIHGGETSCFGVEIEPQDSGAFVLWVDVRVCCGVDAGDLVFGATAQVPVNGIPLNGFS